MKISLLNIAIYVALSVRDALHLIKMRNSSRSAMVAGKHGCDVGIRKSEFNECVLLMRCIVKMLLALIIQTERKRTSSSLKRFQELQFTRI